MGPGLQYSAGYEILQVGQMFFRTIYKLVILVDYTINCLWLKIFKVLNSATYNRYRARRLQMNQTIAKAIADGQTGAYVEEKHLWHGSPFAEKICNEGFNLGAANHGLFGKGKLFEINTFYLRGSLYMIRIQQ